MKIVILKNGADEADVLVASVLVTLNNILDVGVAGTIACYDLVMLCRDPNYHVFGKSKKLLKDNALIDPNGTVHSSISNIVLSWSRGNGTDMVFGVDPIRR